MNRFFESGGQSIGASVLASVLPMESSPQTPLNLAKCSMVWIFIPFLSPDSETVISILQQRQESHHTGDVT